MPFILGNIKYFSLVFSPILCYKYIRILYSSLQISKFPQTFFLQTHFIIFSTIQYYNKKDVIYITNLFKRILFIIILFSIFISIFFIPIIQNNNISSVDSSNKEILGFNPDGFLWPLPGYTSISSPFGPRKSPTGGTSGFHHGTDIPAPEGTKFVAINDGEITFCSFLGAGGYTITLSFDNLKVTYCHASPNFIVKVGDFVKQGQVIGYVGPKYVYGVPGNPYKDSTGKPTNGSTTGCHLHLRF